MISKLKKQNKKIGLCSYALCMTHARVCDTHARSDTHARATITHTQSRIQARLWNLIKNIHLLSTSTKER